MNGRGKTLGAPLIVGGFAGLFLISYLAFLAWNPISGGIITMDRAVKIANDYLNALNNKNLAIDEIEEYQYNFYVIYYEKSTGMGAFEMLIDKVNTGWGYAGIRPEPGPNMMWNTKYGMMGSSLFGYTPGASTISADQAKAHAQGYLDTYLAGAKVGDVREFFGYFTIDIVKDGKIYGMLSINAYTGDIWYHNWHGASIQTRELRTD